VEQKTQSNQADKICRHDANRTSDSMVFKVLNCLLVFLCCRFGRERAQIPALSCFRIFLPRVQTIFTRLKFSDHAALMPTPSLLIADQELCGLVKGLHAFARRCRNKG
jgi:hypothetical protein